MGTGKLEYRDWEVRVWGLGSECMRTGKSGIGTGKLEYRDWEVRV